MCCKYNVYVVRQLMLLTAKCLISISSGIALAIPSVLSSAILAPEGELKVTPSEVSWIVTSIGISGWLGFIFLPLIFEFYGRKITNVAISLIMLTGSLMFFMANEVYYLVCARLIQGLATGGGFVSIVAICECISPKRRGYFMVLYKVFMGLGSMACHSLGLILNWRQIALFGALPSCLSVILFSICVESPAFYAKRGKFDECIKSFEWYRGNSPNAKNELNEFLVAQKENLRTNKLDIGLGVFRKLKRIVTATEFRKSFFIVTLTTLCLDTCGRYFLLIYITKILTELTKDGTTALYQSVAFDFILIFALSVSSILVKHFKRRTLLFKLGFCSVLLMFMISLSIVLISKFNLPQPMKWLTVGLILLHTFVINIGIVPIAFAITGEIYSLEHRGLGTSLSGIISSIFLTVVIRITPVMIDNTGVEGTYSIYGLCLCICLVLLRFILPETKDKTLQQIEDEMKGIVRSKSNSDLVKYSKVINC